MKSEMGKKVFFFFFFLQHLSACGILVPLPRIEPLTPAMEAQTLNHWTTREVPKDDFLEGNWSAALKRGVQLIPAAKHTANVPHSLLRLCNDLYILMTSKKINKTKLNLVYVTVSFSVINIANLHARFI